jgi:hypothetical protein
MVHIEANPSQHAHFNNVIAKTLCRVPLTIVVILGIGLGARPSAFDKWRCQSGTILHCWLCIQPLASMGLCILRDQTHGPICELPF